MSDHSRRYTPEYWDHRRDQLKHDWRPGDDVPLCAQAAPVATAVEIALLARDPNVKLAQAASLIEQYARTVASEGVLEGIARGTDRAIAAINAPLQRKDPANA